MEDTTYNGWTNYQTWSVKLWLDNEEPTHFHAQELLETVRRAGSPIQVLDGVWTREQAERFVLADWLKDWVVDELAPDLGATFAADLLSHALGQVNWEEIAANYLSE